MDWRQAAYTFFDGKSVPRRVRTPDGECKVRVVPSSALKVLHPLGVPLDPEHLAFIARWVQPQSVVWDVGMNMGLFGFPAALKARAGHVYGFEPDAELAAACIASRRLNSGLNLTVISAALSDQDGIASFQVSQRGRSRNQLVGVGHLNDAACPMLETRCVPSLKMDTAAKFIPPPDAIKIDVEGAEMKVLEGGRQVISTQRPVMLVESPAQLHDRFLAFYSSIDYVLLDATDTDPKPILTPTWDTVAVPREKWQLAT